MGAGRTFRWLSAGPLPAACDLRPLGWLLAQPGPGQADDPASIVLAMPHSPGSDTMGQLLARKGSRRNVVVLGIDDSLDRCALLQLGFGDVLAAGLDREELALRAIRVADQAGMVRPTRAFGQLVLDLVERDARVHDQRVRLNPREFALLWRLAEADGAALAPERLLQDVWGLRFRPESNSLAVHISRLRTKLRRWSLDWLVKTGRDGSYRLALPQLTAQGPALQEAPLDDYVRHCTKA